VVRNPRFPESELPRLKQDLRRELAVARQEPAQLTLERFRAVLYPEHPYGRTFPSDAALAGYSLEQVRQFHSAQFGAARARVYVVGRFEPREVRQAVEESLGDWTPGLPPRLSPPEVRPRPEVQVIDRAGAPQSTLMIGLPVPDPSRPEWVGLQVTNALLGGSFASRITSNIREDKGYTYSPRATLSVRYRDAYWAEEADVATEATGASLREIDAEIRRLADEEPPAEELAGIANYLAGTFVLQNSTRQGILGQKVFLDLHGLPDEYLRTWVARVHATTPADVSRLTRDFLVPERMLTVITGDRAKVEVQLAQAPIGI
jgi:predicted Zn-dependent peptidase